MADISVAAPRRVRSRWVRPETFLLLAIPECVVIVFFVIVHADHGFVLTRFAGDTWLFIGNASILVACVLLWAFLRLRATRPTFTAAQDFRAFGFMIVAVATFIGSLVGFVTFTISSVERFTFIDLPGSEQQWVVGEVTGLGQTSIRLYSGGGIIYRQSALSMPLSPDMSSPFRNGEYRVDTREDGWLVSYDAVDGGSYESTVPIPR